MSLLKYNSEGGELWSTRLRMDVPGRVATNEADGTICVSDKVKNRIHVFSKLGDYVHAIQHIDTPYAIASLSDVVSDSYVYVGHREGTGFAISRIHPTERSELLFKQRNPVSSLSMYKDEFLAVASQDGLNVYKLRHLLIASHHVRSGIEYITWPR